MTRTPRQLGFRMPAEWEPHEATWIAWPHNVSDWPGKFQPIPWVYAEIVRRLAPGERVRIIVNSRAHEMAARHVLRRAGVPTENIGFFHQPTDRGWTRDFGPIFVKRDAEVDDPAEIAVIGFRFNGWAKYPNWKRDARVAAAVARKFKHRFFRPEWRGRPVVLEGGCIDANGRGSLLLTEECLLDPRQQVRNPGMSQRELESLVWEYLGAKNVLWLGRGIAGDDTHGHVDDICRFVGPSTVVLAIEDREDDPNYEPLRENRERLEGMRLENGSRIEVVPLPMPSPVITDGQRVPASYANFYISNAAVIVPTFNDPKDRLALGILSEIFRDRPVIGIHSLDLVWGLGTLHCMTQQQPSPTFNRSAS